MPESNGVDRKVLVRTGRGKRAGMMLPHPDVAWRWLGWLGFVLAIAGLTDLVLLWVPVRLGAVEWEFATAVSTASAMPLVSIGFAAMLAFGAATGRRWLLWVIGVMVAVGALVLVSLLVLFVTDVPVALRGTSGDAHLRIVKASVKTVVLSGLFSLAYAIGAVWCFRLAMRRATG